MRRLPLLLALLLPACVNPNPAFNDCSQPGACGIGDESGDEEASGTEAETTEGESAQSESDTADSAQTGEDEQDPPAPDDPEDPSEDETQGEEEGLLPTCPAFETFALGMVQDTFLDTSDYNFGCVLDWNYFTNSPSFDFGSDCASRDFGGHEDHWACSEGDCRSAWLGQFELAGLVQQLEGTSVDVVGARIEFTARIGSEDSNEARLYALEVGAEEFGECETWSAGPGEGSAPEDCVTTGAYAAYPTPWSSLELEYLPEYADEVGAVTLPGFGDDLPYGFELEFEPSVVAEWLDGEDEHGGVLLTTDGQFPTDFNLRSSSSDTPPKLFVDLCEP